VTGTWHNCGTSRIRVSTTVDEDLLTSAREKSGLKDAALLDEALTAFLAKHRSAEIDAAYEAAYTRHPFNEPDEWGDLESWGKAAGAS